MSVNSNYTTHKLGDVKVTMEMPDGTRVEVMRKKVDVKRKLGWKVVSSKKKE